METRHLRAIGTRGYIQCPMLIGVIVFYLTTPSSDKGGDGQVTLLVGRQPRRRVSETPYVLRESACRGDSDQDAPRRIENLKVCSDIVFTPCQNRKRSAFRPSLVASSVTGSPCPGPEPRQLRLVSGWRGATAQPPNRYLGACLAFSDTE